MTTPFDPLAAGWVACRCRCHGPEFEHQDVGACPICDGLGIVVGPPEDGLAIARLVVGSDTSVAMAPWGEAYGLILHANAYTRP